MKDRKKQDKFLLPPRMPSDDREFAFSSRVFPMAAQIKAPYKLWHYQLCTRLSRAPSTMGPSDFLQLVTRDLRCARLSRRYRSSLRAVSEAAGSLKSTKVPLSAFCGAEPRKSQHRLTLSRLCWCCLPFWGTR